ncbi:WD40 repeat-like protein [Auriscalpium vulgare]|uniref:WD40 repeat-like protein n=1 Tax=Auriscalpium vulgare TaxID=40419 RepID=A0ACB8RGR5_9AGAM|nr:WD40 repeat-like protein [Auriscalpium vulgare]
MFSAAYDAGPPAPNIVFRGTPAPEPPPPRPTLEQSTFVAPEGVYSITEDHRAIPVVHNAPTPLFPTRLSAVTVRFPTKQTGAPGLGQLLGGGKDFWKDRNLAPPKEDGLSVSSSDTPEEGTSPDVTNLPDSTPATPVIAPDPPGLFSPAQGGKRRPLSRPKHNMRTTSSTFITRLQSQEGLARTLASKQGEVTYVFYNSAKNLYWVEGGQKSKEPLARIAFSAFPTCHDVNQSTVSHEHLDIIIGYNTGDLLWFDPITSRYARLNKQGRISGSACTAVRWVPSSPNLFLVSHADGTIIVYDKDRDDGVFSPQAPTASSPILRSLPGSPAMSPPPAADTPPGEWNPLDSIFVTMPPWHPVNGAAGAAGGGGKAEKDKDKATKNPVSHWKVSKRSVVDFVFSPDVKYVAAISEDGCLRVIDALAEQLVDCYAAYFGSLTCVAWSPDGRFIITGGQDDLVNIFSPWEQRVIARCQGHSSFVSGLAFDDVRCDGRTYRFGSVGEDNKIILWDFSSGILHRPKLQSAHVKQSMSVSSTISLSLRRRDGTAERSTLHLPPPGADGPSPRYHPAPSRNEVAVVQPVLVKQLEDDLLTAVMFLPRWLLTASKTGLVKLWIRPLVIPGRPEKGGHAQRAMEADLDLVQ